MSISWNDVNLDPDERSTLDVLVKNLNYLGRSESWMKGRVMAEGELALETNCFPEKSAEPPGHGWEQVALLAATSAPYFASWRARQLDEALAVLPLPDGREPSKTLLREREKAVEPYPTDLLDCLQKDTNWLRQHGWNQPPGSRRVFYWRKADAIGVGAPRAKLGKVTAGRVEAMLLSLTNTSRNDYALPSVLRTLPQADLVHRSLVSITAKTGAPTTILTGCDNEGRPLKGAHEHAHINPLDLDGDGHIDHVLIWAPAGLDAHAQDAIRAVRRTFTKGGLEPLRLALAMSGDLTQLTHLPAPYGGNLKKVVSPNGARVWQSLTPFVPPRFIKRRGKNTLAEQVNAELRSRGLPEPVRVLQLALGSIPEDRDPDWFRFRHFILSRENGPQPPIPRGFAIRIEFEQPVQGPLALGYASHFGLGMFAMHD